VLERVVAHRRDHDCLGPGEIARRDIITSQELLLALIGGILKMPSLPA
jgi:hypothetical protein